VQGRFLVNCAGAFSDEIASLAGDDFFRICPRAGEYLILDQEVGTMVSHTIFRVPTKAGKGILVTPTADGNLLLGPTADQVESPFDTQTTAQGLEKVKKEALSMVPSIPLSKVITSFTGVRASTSGGDFIIQSSARVEGLLHLAAIDSPGLTCCVSIARRAVQELEQMGLCLDKKEKWIATREDPRAFQTLSIQEKNAWIQRDPSYGRIVCRCEKISEGEILNAIRQNPPARDLDGVKRRTRSGMGRCQGGFCAPHVMRLLGAELEIPQEEVTKSGGGSVMIKGRIGK
jgi:glycerol-3-phosphate dehydrogenase